MIPALDFDPIDRSALFAIEGHKNTARKPDGITRPQINGDMDRAIPVGGSGNMDGGAIPAVKAQGRLGSAVGAETSPSKPINPRCLKHQRGESCKWALGHACCWQCTDAAAKARAA